ncbi:MAG TPA: LPS export ABC transporter periplasmic protein LptC [Steroidobacteraceae bacterium]|nr:LPS export ABC transporter periplasmic protein LptC [Steroidobacteraceae bacterium]
MSWRWVSLTGLLAALVVSYGIFTGQPRDDGIMGGAEREQPGYYLKDAVILDTSPDGSPAVRLAARRIEQNPSEQSIALEEVTVDYLALEDQHWRLTADTGVVPSGSQTITFVGNVTLESQEQPQSAVIRTETLSVDTVNSIASTAAPVSIEIGGHSVNAQGMVADLEDNRVQLESDVHGRFVPE